MSKLCDSLFLLVLTLFWCLYLVCSESYVCNPSICTTKKCFQTKTICKEGTEKLITNSTECGCCHKCVKLLSEGEECVYSMNGNIPSSECGPGLLCLNSFCQKYTVTKCMEEREKLKDFVAGNEPECDEYGEYADIQCKEGALCFCVDEDGNRIFGETLYADKGDRCSCSRDYAKLSKFLKTDTIARSGQFLRCDSNGDYNYFQDVGDYVYCSTAGGKLERAETKGKQKSLRCRRGRSLCWTQLEEVNQRVEKIKREEKYTFALGYHFPQCDLDGTFGAKQCNGSHCYCVKKSGEMYTNTLVDRMDPRLEETMKCNCVRDLDTIRKLPSSQRNRLTDAFLQYKCNRYGDYEGTQCVETGCYCVDENGFQTWKAEPLSRKHLLPCFSP